MKDARFMIKPKTIIRKRISNRSDKVRSQLQYKEISLLQEMASQTGRKN